MESRRATLVDDISRETGITDAMMVADLVETFYGRVRRDALLAPVFARVEDWDGHLAKLRAFWSSVVLMSGRYHGQPMQAHFPLSIEPAALRPLARAVRADDNRCLPAGCCSRLHGEGPPIADSLRWPSPAGAAVAGPRHSKSPSTSQRSKT